MYSFFRIKEHRHIDFDLFILFDAAMVCIQIQFFYCFFGKIATESFARMADCLYESNWLILKPKLQKYLVLMIGNAQRPVYYHGFGLATLNLETFAYVSYFSNNDTKNK